MSWSSIPSTMERAAASTAITTIINIVIIPSGRHRCPCFRSCRAMSGPVVAPRVALVTTPRQPQLPSALLLAVSFSVHTESAMEVASPELRPRAGPPPVRNGLAERSVGGAVQRAWCRMPAAAADAAAAPPAAPARLCVSSDAGWDVCCVVLRRQPASQPASLQPPRPPAPVFGPLHRVEHSPTCTCASATQRATRAAAAKTNTSLYTFIHTPLGADPTNTRASPVPLRRGSGGGISKVASCSRRDRSGEVERGVAGGADTRRGARAGRTPR